MKFFRRRAREDQKPHAPSISPAEILDVHRQLIELQKSTGLHDAALTNICRPMATESAIELIKACGLTNEAFSPALPLPPVFKGEDAPLKQFLYECSSGAWYFGVNIQPKGLGELARSKLSIDVQAGAMSSMINSHFCMWDKVCALSHSDWHAIGVALRGPGHPFVVIGDSHSSLYRRVVEFEDGRSIPIHVFCVGGSAMGLGSATSRSGYNVRIQHLAREVLPFLGEKIPVLMQFGQVDTEFVYNFQRAKVGQKYFDLAHYADFCQKSVDRYVQFMVSTFPDRNFLVCSIFPPALSDEAWAVGYANGHVVAYEADSSYEEIISSIKEIEIPSQSERTTHHALYNKLLRDACKREGLSFVNDFDMFPIGDILDPMFVPERKGADHHIEFVPAALPMQTVIRSVMSR